MKRIDSSRSSLLFLKCLYGAPLDTPQRSATRLIDSPDMPEVCISSMAATALTPEQAAVWSYPHFEADEEEAIFNMVNAMLGRVHQAGHLNKLPAANFARVKEGIACYKSIRDDIKTGLPIIP